MGKVKELYTELISLYGDRCCVCGKSDVPLQLDHIIPKSLGGTSGVENLRLVCPQCNASMASGPKEIEFVAYLYELLKLNSNFRQIQKEFLFGEKTRFRANLFVQENENKVWRDVLIECKSFHSLQLNQIHAAAFQLKTYSDILSPSQTPHLVLAIPGRCSSKAQTLLQSLSIELWDIDYIANTFAEQIIKIPHPYFQPLLVMTGGVKKESEEEKLINELKACPTGRKYCYLYQDLVGKILEHLFTPPLEKPLPELADDTRSNRRDYIIPNYADKGFWAFLRNQYRADYIIVDAKNSKNNVTKAAVLQIANY